MIPILYEKNEKYFISNGIGRLRDCISCTVTEERNGAYECDFEYPVTGIHFEDIQHGRIILVTHDDTGIPQPFDIVGHTKPINGIVGFHAVHISYRLNFIVCRATKVLRKNSMTPEMHMDYARSGDIMDQAPASYPSCPFTFQSDITSAAKLPFENDAPLSMRQVLGGKDGSILDTFHCEFEWDYNKVYMWKRRGTKKDFAIRYGVNLMNYTDELDSSSVYNAVCPYWIGDDGNGIQRVATPTPVVSGREIASGRTACIPLNVTDQFEEKPTLAQIRAKGLQYMNANNSYNPAQTITVEFVRLQDSPEYEEYKNLLTCNLCDSIDVIFPLYGMTGEYKIVKTVYNALKERYDSMELGTLSATLSQALSTDISREGVKGVYRWSGFDGKTLTFLNNQKIQGIDTHGNNVNALEPCNSSNNTVLGYGNYAKTEGNTNIYGGVDINLIARGNIKFASTLFQNLFVVDTGSVTISSISANGYNSATGDAVTKSGYYPIGIVGYDITGTGSGSIPPTKYYLTSRAEGTCKVFAGLHNDSSSARTNITFKAYILWIKII